MQVDFVSSKTSAASAAERDRRLLSPIEEPMKSPSIGGVDLSHAGLKTASPTALWLLLVWLCPSVRTICCGAA